jgi:hypothetical protein
MATPPTAPKKVPYRQRLPDDPVPERPARLKLAPAPEAAKSKEGEPTLTDVMKVLLAVRDENDALRTRLRDLELAATTPAPAAPPGGDRG